MNGQNIGNNKFQQLVALRAIRNGGAKQVKRPVKESPVKQHRAEQQRLIRPE